ncbi:MAG TPA: pilus assembly protein PilM [Methylomirabilota bacterium]|nr:pilus assembly protein PilM [Methylomirabilota bacterium]
MNSATAFRQGIYKSELVRRITRWLDATPHPPLALEITPERVAAARFGRTGALDGYAVETLPQGAIVPSAVESNIGNPAAVKLAVSSACARLKAKDEDVALILPDPVIRVFVQHFDEFPRSAQEAEPMLRWKLKKSVPFEVDETLISYMRQSPREDGVDIVTALARLRIVREYEALAEAVELRPGVVLSSSLAAITLLDDQKPTLLARVSENSLTTVIVREGVLCGYRCTELPAQGLDLTPQMLLEEIYPVAAYYQDTWREGVQAVSLTGLGSRLPEFLPPFQEEFRCEISSLLHSAVAGGRVHDDVRPLAERELEGLVGWAMHRG